MVALLVSLRWRQFLRQLARNPWAIVGAVFGLIAAAGVLAGLTATVGVLRVAQPTLVPTLLVVVGTLFVVGWGVVAIVQGADDLMAPERFALLPQSARRLLPGLLAADAAGIGGITTTIALLLMLVGWSVSVPALIAAIVMMPVALLTCVLFGRVLGGALARQLASRRMRDLTAVVVMLLALTAGLGMQALLAGASRVAALPEIIGHIGGVLAWTPLGAAFGVPAAVAAGSWGTAVAQFAIAVATVVLLLAAARSLFAGRLERPIVASGGGRVREGRILDRLLPASPLGAIAARSLRYRRRDPRHIINVLSLAIMPLVMIGAVLLPNIQFGEGFEMLPLAIVLLPAIDAILVASIAQMDASYDHDALTLHMLTGTTGRDDRAGRMLAIGILVVPILIAACIACCLAVGRMDLLPASLGAAFGPTLVAAGAGIWLGVYLPGRTPAPEANPLGTGSAGGAQSLVALLALAPLTALGGGPAFGFAIAAFWTPWLGWVSLALALAIGALAVWLGIRAGGAALDRRWPEVLHAITRDS